MKVPVQRSRVVWSCSENVGSYLLTDLFKQKVKTMLTDKHKSSVPDINVESIPMHEWNRLKENATNFILAGQVREK